MKGKNNIVREYLALIAPTSEYCVIPNVDAFALGFSEAAKLDPGVAGPNRVDFVSSAAYGRGTKIKIPMVEIGSFAFKDIYFVTYDASQATGFDVILGKNLLEEMKLELDFPNHLMKLERVVRPQ